MSWSIGINGHREDQEQEGKAAEIEEIIAGVVKTAVESLKAAGVTYADCSVYPRARRVLFNVYGTTSGEEAKAPG